MGYLLAKNLLRVSDKVEIRHTSKSLCAEKNTSKYFFLSGALIIVKMEFEISKYLQQYFYCLIIFYKGNLR